jgi:glycosyltransferase involved in cell wall biosynthesis
MPRVSVVLPSYNHAKFIDSAISSVLEQSYGDLELVIVDDGSTDASTDRILVHDDERIVTHFQENQGAHAAINKGIALASESSEYIAILNSDDVHKRDWLKEAVRAMDADPELGFCAGLLEFPGDDDDDKKNWYAGALSYYRRVGDVTRALTHRNFIMTTSNVVIRKSVLRTTGCFRPLRYVHDLDLFLRLAAVSRFRLLEGTFVEYRIHPANTIAEGEKNCRIVYEFAWILVDRIYREYSASHRPEELFRRIADMVAVLDLPEVACAAMALFPLRAALDMRRASDAEVEAFALSLLAEDNPVMREMIAHKRSAFSTRIEEMKMQIGKIEYDLREALENREAYTADLQARIRHLEQSGRYQIGQAFDEARNLRGLVQLPGKFLHIALSKGVRNGKDSVAAPAENGKAQHQAQPEPEIPSWVQANSVGRN